ncbi:MAG: UDP-N-acetylmuramoyl-L-alanine--D-glutamate ligase, partial [Deltaproteobacteria bacterium]|nr:UDP-N-acetylmuramoyl-L-alanine--D-glutamate ligase [Deltaproteobacteria bacterium]
MISELLDFLTTKKIIIVGYGAEGRSTLKFLEQHKVQSKITVADKNIIEELKNVEIISGADYLNNLDSYDLIIKSPGVVFSNELIKKHSPKLTSQVDLFLRFAPGLKIGITGTKGKSTTSTLLYEMLKADGKKTMLIGNIGTPCFDMFSETTPEHLVVMELSSHQTQTLKHSPDIAVLLNVFPEHLDYYESFEDYERAKRNIFAYIKDKNNIFDFSLTSNEPNQTNPSLQ